MSERLAELPAEFPAEAGEGGGGVFRRPVHIAELPQFLAGAASLQHELLRLRSRLNSLEEQLLFSGFRVGPGSPNELPEGAEFGGGTAIFRRPGHINELPPFELLASINEKLIEVTERLGAVEQTLQGMREAGG